MNEIDEESAQFTIMNEQETGQENVFDGETHAGNEGENMSLTPASQQSVSRLDRDNYDYSATPKKFRSINDVYADLEEVMLDEELFLMGIDEPPNFKQAVKDSSWKKAINRRSSPLKRTEPRS